MKIYSKKGNLAKTRFMQQLPVQTVVDTISRIVNVWAKLLPTTYGNKFVLVRKFIHLLLRALQLQ